MMFEVVKALLKIAAELHNIHIDLDLLIRHINRSYEE